MFIVAESTMNRKHKRSACIVKTSVNVSMQNKNLRSVVSAEIENAFHWVFETTLGRLKG